MATPDDDVVRLPIDGELDLHHFRPKDIKTLVPDYLVECQKVGILQVRLVHGKGTGSLARGVVALLERNPIVASFQTGGHVDGGWGATLVDLHPPPDDVVVETLKCGPGATAWVRQGEQLLHVVFADDVDSARGGALQKNAFAKVSTQSDSSVAERMAKYFDGDLAALDDTRLAPLPSGLDARVRGELAKIPVGTTTTYAALTKSLGMPASAARAVGGAVGRNCVPIVVPCHRVIGSDGELRGFVGGLHWKRFLLEHEGALTQRELF